MSIYCIYRNILYILKCGLVSPRSLPSLGFVIARYRSTVCTWLSAAAEPRRRAQAHMARGERHIS